MSEESDGKRSEEKMSEESASGKRSEEKTSGKMNEESDEVQGVESDKRGGGIPFRIE